MENNDQNKPSMAHVLDTLGLKSKFPFLPMMERKDITNTEKFDTLMRYRKAAHAGVAEALGERGGAIYSRVLKGPVYYTFPYEKSPIAVNLWSRADFSSYNTGINITFPIPLCYYGSTYTLMAFIMQQFGLGKVAFLHRMQTELHNWLNWSDSTYLLNDVIFSRMDVRDESMQDPDADFLDFPMFMRESRRQTYLLDFEITFSEYSDDRRWLYNAIIRSVLYSAFKIIMDIFDHNFYIGVNESIDKFSPSLNIAEIISNATLPFCLSMYNDDFANDCDKIMKYIDEKRFNNLEITKLRYEITKCLVGSKKPTIPQHLIEKFPNLVPKSSEYDINELISLNSDKDFRVPHIPAEWLKSFSTDMLDELKKLYREATKHE